MSATTKAWFGGESAVLKTLLMSVATKVEAGNSMASSWLSGMFVIKLIESKIRDGRMEYNTHHGPLTRSATKEVSVRELLKVLLSFNLQLLSLINLIKSRRYPTQH